MDKIEILVIEDLAQLPTVDIKTAVVLPDGREGYLHPSGVIKNSKGHFMFGGEINGGALPFNSASASEAVTIREEAKNNAVLEALAEHGAGNWVDGVKKLAQVQVKIASKESNRRDATNAFIELLKIAGIVRSKYTQEDPTTPAGVETLDSGDMVILKAITNRIKEIQAESRIEPDKVQKQELSSAVDLALLDQDAPAVGG